MATSTIKNLCSVALSASVVARYQAPAGTTGVVRSATVCNSTAGVVALTLYKVPNAGSADNTNVITSAVNVAPGETYQCYELLNKVVEPGGTIQAVGDGLTLVVDGVEVVQ